jgi:serine phosphatase RsbU (regulator of sigma subunit)
MPLSTVDRLTLIFQVSQLFNSTLNLDKVLNMVIDQVIAALRAERGIILLYDADHQLQVRAARGVDQQTLASPQFEFSRSIVRRVAEDGEPQLTSDARDDRWLSQRESVHSLGLRSVLCVPLLVKGSRIGVIYIDNRLQAGVFMPADLNLLINIADSAATAIENARLYEIAIEKGRLEQELQMARSLQASLIPKDPPQLQGWDIAARWYPAHQVSGDYYDFLELDSGEIGLVIADVSDKGMGAALFMMLARTVIRASVIDASSPAAAISRANRLICADETDGMLVSLCYLTLDPATGHVSYVNAGHNPPLHFRSQEPEPLELTRTGMILGIDGSQTYRQIMLRMEPGDLLFLYTDGIIDAQNQDEEFFGLGQVQQLIQSWIHLPADAILEKLMKAAQDFTSRASTFDDITLMIVKSL